jgi:hypothetical protein
MKGTGMNVEIVSAAYDASIPAYFHEYLKFKLVSKTIE